MNPKPGRSMRKHANELASELLRRFAFELHRAARPGSAGAIHDLRVSIRRLTQCLRVFAQFFPRGGVKKIRRSLKALMAQAAEVRNRDIALELLELARLPEASPLVQRLTRERQREHRRLATDLNHWSRRGSFRKWRAQLEL